MSQGQFQFDAAPPVHGFLRLPREPLPAQIHAAEEDWPAPEPRFPGWPTLSLPSGLEVATGQGVAYGDAGQPPSDPITEGERKTLEAYAALWMRKPLRWEPIQGERWAGRAWPADRDGALLGLFGTLADPESLFDSMPKGAKAVFGCRVARRFLADGLPLGGPSIYCTASGLMRWMAAAAMRPVVPPMMGARFGWFVFRKMRGSSL